VDAYPNRLFQARIEKLRYASTTLNNVVSYVAVLSVNNEDLALRPGMTATAEIVTAEKKDALLVPNGATRFTPPDVPVPDAPKSDNDAILKFVWMLKDGDPAARALNLGLTNGQQTEVLDGDIAEGDQVLVDIAQKAK
jgi:HlyD family secretion protein